MQLEVGSSQSSERAGGRPAMEQERGEPREKDMRHLPRVTECRADRPGLAGAEWQTRLQRGCTSPQLQQNGKVERGGREKSGRTSSESDRRDAAYCSRECFRLSCSDTSYCNFPPLLSLSENHVI